jgi:hypothetical protein
MSTDGSEKMREKRVYAALKWSEDKCDNGRDNQERDGVYILVFDLFSMTSGSVLHNTDP